MKKEDDDQQIKSINQGLGKMVIPRFTSQELFTSANELIIQHNGQQYHLRITSNGKLILTK